MHGRLSNYFSTFHRLLTNAEASDARGMALSFEDGVTAATAMLQGLRQTGNKAMVIGNGGSAGISSHVAIDYTKNGGYPTQAFNDGAALTCLGNDLGYENVFAKQIEFFGKPGDLLIAISSSGRSPNIIKATDAARATGCRILTLSGFTPDNPLRSRGDTNFYVASGEYGFVELSHLAICHAILDLSMGWNGSIPAKTTAEAS